MAVDPTEVDRLLSLSHATHDRAKTARYRKQPDALSALTAARDLRVEAHALDPDHEAAAWALEETSHAAFMTFYQKQLTS